MTSGKAGEREASKRRQERVKNKKLTHSLAAVEHICNIIIMSKCIIIIIFVHSETI